MRHVPVLMYHHINSHKRDMVTITPEVFERQMEYLHRAKYRALKIPELLSFINGDLILKEKAVVLTFDDGWLDNYLYAFPVLKKYKLNATIFIITDRVEQATTSNPPISPLNLRGDEGGGTSIPTHEESKLLIEKGEGHKVVLNWRLIKEMADSGLVEFYSHTKSHRKCDRLSEDELIEELSGSKKIIGERLGGPCPYLCWPYGNYNDTAIGIAKDTGFKAIFTVKPGIVKRDSNPFEINRIVVKDSVAWFKKRMLIYTNKILSDLYLKLKIKKNEN